ncbi:Mitochondrial tRNAs modification protein [Friedmanniomyces endolithicus]|nr:Mitochondrial tRNAs modification protein [Friedmanniomyces endolithicus]
MVAHAAKKRLLPNVHHGTPLEIAWRTWTCSGRRSAASATREDCRHRYRVLAIETSCDDTSVALVTARKFRGIREEQECAPKWALESHYHERLTANNEAHRGIHPLVALESHRASTAPLVKQALKVLQEAGWGKQSGDDGRLDFVAVTRGPGMRSNLSVGLDTAKGIAAALDIPLVGVHHMQAHALTPRLMTAIANADESQKHGHCAGANGEYMSTLEPALPFLTLLVSGGHTMLLDSRGLTEHRLLAETGDIAVGQFLDKAARAILLPELLEAPYGRALEDFAFQTVSEYGGTSGSCDQRTIEDPAHAEPCQAQYEYSPPQTQQDLMKRHDSPWGWSLSPPLVERAGGESKRMAYSFAGLLTFVERLVTQRAADTGGVTLAERRALAQEVQRVAFEHLASRVLLYLTSRQAADWKGDTIVVSGGVAANTFLRHVLRSILDARGFRHIKLAFPPIELSTDNALMIAWAGIEMYDAAPDGGILGAPGWMHGEHSHDDGE